MSTLFSHFDEKINQISPLDENFTEVLNTIALMPKTLYYYGKIPQKMSKNGKNIRPKTVAIVGSRHNTRYGEEIAYRLAFTLAKYGVVIISGLAYGIDSIAHRGCLDAGGITVAVLGTPINQIYPKPHISLAHQIIQQNGAIVSEYPPNNADPINIPLAPGEYINNYNQRAVDHKTSFLYRNRIISGLSDIVVVVEAAEQSGSLNTATHAIEQGKEVFAVPGNITNPYSRGCNRLIAQGAYPYTSPDDILSLLFPEDYYKKQKRLKKNHLIGDTDVETNILQSIASGNSTSEEIMEDSMIPPEVFNQNITLLEIKGRIRAIGMNSWTIL